MSRQTWLKWLLGSLTVLTLAACAPGGNDTDDEDTRIEQNDEEDDD